MLVKVRFHIGRDEYEVIRGIKPKVFEIWKNGEMLNQNSKARDYQKVLEQNILKLNHKSFHQIVVLGSSSFIPFMQLPKQHRREVIEDLLDISIFSKMNNLLKDQKASVRDNIQSLEHEIDSIQRTVKLQKNHIEQLEEISNQNRTRLKQEIQEIKSKIEESNEQKKAISKEIEELLEEVKSLDDQNTIKREKLYGFDGKINSSVSTLKKEISFFEGTDDCPTCLQKITEETKTLALQERQKTLNDLNAKQKILKEEINRVEDQYQKFLDKQTLLNTKRSQFMNYESSINTMIEQIQSKMKVKPSTDLTKHKEELEQTLQEENRKRTEKVELLELQNYQGTMEELLKDSGIKTKIIRQYLPVINRLINEYLQIFDFFVSFTLDEELVEKVRSRHRDDFSYSSFSEGEKARLDLALMFTWRQVAKMKNSIDTNLLILDETFDSSLDSEGVEGLLKVLYSLDDQTNTFIISHKTDVLEGRFENKLLVYKKNLFTKVKDISES
jgi:DNA repair exonuclease SbcCD ATPase subunit